MRSAALPLISAFCAAVYSSPTLTSKPPLLSYEQFRRTPVAVHPSPAPMVFTYDAVNPHFSFHSTYDTSSTKRSGEIEGIALEVRQSTCNTHCKGNHANAADIVDAQIGLSNHFDHGCFKGSIVCKTNVCAFGCDYGSGRTYSSSQYPVHISCVTNACGPSQAGYDGHTWRHSTYGRDLDLFTWKG